MRCYECGNRMQDGQEECPTCHAVLWALDPTAGTAPAPLTVAPQGDSSVSERNDGQHDVSWPLSRGQIALQQTVAATQSVLGHVIPAKRAVHGRVIIADAAYSERPDWDVCKIITRILWIMLLVLSPILILYWLAVKVGGLPALLAFVGLFLLVKFVSPTNLYAMFRIFSVLNPAARDSAEQVPVRYFRVREDGTDAEVMVRMKGMFTRGNIGQEDVVTLCGRCRGGTLYATHGYNHRTSSSVRLACSYSWVGLVLTLLFIFFLTAEFYEPTMKVARTVSSLGGAR